MNATKISDYFARPYSNLCGAADKLTDLDGFNIIPPIPEIDGMVMDDMGNLYVAGFSRNEIWKIYQNKQAKVIVRFPDNNEANGELDQPVDLIIKNEKLIISNFDLMSDPDMVNSSHDKPYTLTYFKLEAN